jgi:hypothetical protein
MAATILLVLELKVSTTNYIKLAIIMADDFYNQNIGPLKGSYFGPGVGGSESQRRFSDYYTKSINPVRESIKETEERKMKAERARQLIEAEKERREKAAREAELELAAQKKVDGVVGEVDTILQIEDPVERQAAFNKLESSLSIADRQDPTIKATLSMGQQDIDEAKEETQAQREAQDSETESMVKLLIERGRLNQARKAIRKISDPTKKNELRSLLAGKKPSAAEGLKSDFTDLTKTATTALAALSKITPSSTSPESEDKGPKTVTEDKQGKPPQGENMFDWDRDTDSGGSTRSSNQQIYRAARNAYFTLFGAEEADKLFKDDPDNMTPKELSDLFDTATKKVAEIKRKSRANKKFFRQFVPGEGILPLPEKPKEPTPENPFGGKGFGGK